jgi:ribosomal protein S18 acetylase RimI-like enzyme
VKLSLPALHLPATPRVESADRPAHLRSLARRLTPTFETHYHFTHDLDATPPREIELPDVYTTTIDSPAHSDFPHMLTIAREQNLDRTWCEDQLAEGARCAVALLRHHDTDLPVGMGLFRTQPFWIEEIRHHFTPGPRGCYLYALYVSPRFRGRGIQHALAAARLHLALAQGRRYAYSLVLNTNRASLKGHSARGAIPSARIDCLRLGPLHLTSIRKLHPSLPTGTFPHTGFPRNASFHVIAARA